MDDLFGSDSESGEGGVEESGTGGKKRMTLEYPRYPRIQSDGKACFARLSTIFGVQQTPFSPNNYTGEDQMPMVKVDDFGQTKTRMAPEHIIRWRYARNNKGERIRQSNAKMVKWSDGTMCLYVGEECFTMTESSLRVPQRLCTKSNEALQSQGQITSRLMFQPTSKAAASRGATIAGPTIDQPIVLTPKVQAELRARAEAQEESMRLSTQTNKKRRGGPSATRLDADFLEEGSDLGATKAAYKKSVALSRERDSSRRLMDIKSGAKKQKRREEDFDDASDDSFIASDGEVSDPSISDEE
jgi:RNA polymerase-associated protein LEO1